MSPSTSNDHRSSTSTVGSTSPSFTRSNTTDSTFTPSFFSRIKTSRPRSNSPGNRSNTSPLPSPTAEEPSRRPNRLHLRSDSSLSQAGMTTPSPRGRSRSTKRNSGTYVQVGRHGNDWLFGGFSFTEAVKGLLSPSSDGHHHQHHHDRD